MLKNAEGQQVLLCFTILLFTASDFCLIITLSQKHVRILRSSESVTRIEMRIIDIV